MAVLLSVHCNSLLLVHRVQWGLFLTRRPTRPVMEVDPRGLAVGLLVTHVRNVQMAVAQSSTQQDAELITSDAALFRTWRCRVARNPILVPRAP